MQAFAPFGPDNMKPVFVTRGVVNAGGCRLVGKEQEHLKLELRDPATGACMSGIAFGKGKEFIDHLLDGKPVSVCYTVEENNFAGRKTLQLMVKDLQKQ